MKLTPLRSIGAALAICAALPTTAAAADEDLRAQQNRELMTRETVAAVESGLAYLAARQHADGSFGSGGLYTDSVGVTALAGMAFLAAGHTPGQGRYGKVLDDAVGNLLSRCDASGFIHNPAIQPHGPMYGHGFAVMFLAEAYGMSQRDDLKPCLSRAVQLILNCQNKQGGWRYMPRKEDADISVTVCQIMALRAAKNAGLYVPKETIDAAVEYIRKSQNTDGGFRYQLGRQPESAFARSAAAVVGLNSAGIYEGPEIERGLAYLQRFKPDPASPRRIRPMQVDHYMYGHYYAVQAFWHSGGDEWPSWYAPVRDELLALKQASGRWGDRHSNPICPEYDTAMACLILEMPLQLLPIFQK